MLAMFGVGFMVVGGLLMWRARMRSLPDMDEPIAGLSREVVYSRGYTMFFGGLIAGMVAFHRLMDLIASVYLFTAGPAS